MYRVIVLFLLAARRDAIHRVFNRNGIVIYGRRDESRLYNNENVAARMQDEWHP